MTASHMASFTWATDELEAAYQAAPEAVTIMQRGVIVHVDGEPQHVHAHGAAGIHYHRPLGIVRLRMRTHGEQAGMFTRR